MTDITIINSKNERNYGIDLLRIVSMIMVVTLHILGHGGVIGTAKNGSATYYTALLVEAMCYCAVNCYALISGYVGVKAKYKISNILILWARVLFYTIIIAIAFRFINPSVGGKGIFLFQFIPLLSKQYWYFNAYVVLFLFFPVLNYALNNLAKRSIQFFIVSIVSIVSVTLPVTWIVSGDAFALADGYSALWLMVLYIIGGYIRKYGLLRKMKTAVLLLLYFVFSLITWISKLGIQYITKTLLGEEKFDYLFYSYLSITVLMSAVFLLLVFERIKIKRTIVKIISIASPLAFSVYLLHENYYINSVFITEKFSWIVGLPLYQFILVLIGIVLFIYFACSVIDLFRHYLFKVIKLKQRFDKLETTIKRRLYKGSNC